MRIVFSLGGSIIAPNDIDTKQIKIFSDFIKRIAKKHSIGIVVGGGKIARRYINAVHPFKPSEFFCDIIGIYATRLNACVVSSSLGGIANDIPAETITDAAKIIESGKIAVMGGTHPGHTTDGVSAMLAEYIKADLLINLTAVDGVYDKDPKTYKNARKIKKLNFDDLIKIVGETKVNAGLSTVIDPMAAKIIKRAQITTVVINGKDIKGVEKAIEGKPFEGSIITSE